MLRGGHGPCQDTCSNSLGGYTCSCENLKGTQLSQDGHSCEEIDLCSINNGGCSHTCQSTIGKWFFGIDICMMFLFIYFDSIN